MSYVSKKKKIITLHQLSETKVSASYSHTLMGGGSETHTTKKRERKWLTILQGTKSATTSLLTIRHVDAVVLHLGKVL